MKLKLIALAALSGVLLSLAWLGVSGFVLCFAFIPLLFINNYFVQNRNANTSYVFWLYSFVTFAFWNTLSTWWIWKATPAGAVFAIVVNTFLMSLVWWAFHYANRKKGDGFARVFLIFAWLSFEYLHYNWELSWPWLTLGNGLANDVLFIQWFEFTGVFGGSLWILLINLLLWNILKKYLVGIQGIMLSQFVILSVVWLFPIVFSLTKYFTYNEHIDPVRVVVLQPNIDPYYNKYSGMSTEYQYDILLSLADSIGDTDVDFFIGPETALHEVWQDSINYDYTVLLFSQFLKSKYANAGFICGAMTYLNYHKEKLTVTARSNSDSAFFYDAFNSALFISDNNLVEISHKSKLVSGVEKMPYKKHIKFLDHLIIDLGGTTGTLATVDTMVVFRQNQSIIGVPICFESVFGGYCSQFIQNGANLLFIITNDGWWDNTPGYKQHLAFARIQAIEFRRSIARSANTGISCIVNQKGEIVELTNWNERTAIKGELNRNNILTFYAKHGDYIARISLFMFLIMVLSLFTTVIRRK